MREARRERARTAPAGAVGGGRVGARREIVHCWGRSVGRRTEGPRHAESRARHGACGRRGTGSARAGSGGRGGGAGRSARRAPGGAPISPTRHAPRIPAAARSCGEASPTLRAASGALSDSRGYRTRVVDVPLHFVSRGHPGPLRVPHRVAFGGALRCAPCGPFEHNASSAMSNRRGRKGRASRGLPRPGHAARARTCDCSGPCLHSCIV